MHTNSFQWLVAGLAVLALSTGCQSAHEDHDHIVYFHKPTDVKQAVARLTEIHEVMLSNDPLPAPQEFETHGHGHHHSHGSHDHGDHDHGDHDHGDHDHGDHDHGDHDHGDHDHGDHDHGDHDHGDHDHDGHDHGHGHTHGHGHGHEIVSVGIFEEWCDVVRWLPSIAANSDMEKSEWDQINGGCQSLSDLVASLSGNQSDAEKRKIYIAHEKEIQQMLQTVKQANEAFEQANPPSPHQKELRERQDNHG